MVTVDDRLRQAAHEVRALSTAPVPPLSRPASRRRTIRWAAVPAIGLATLLVAALVVVATRGGPTVVAVSPPSASIDAVFRGASISTSIDWHGTVLAAGVIRPQGCTPLPTPAPPSASCQSSGALPVVWSSTGGSGWARTWMGNSAQIASLRQSAQGSIATETLLDGGDRLFLLSSLTFPAAITPGIPRLEMWESSDAVTWSAVPLPTGLGASTLLAAVYGHDRIVVLAGLPGSSTVWTSADGSSWQSSTSGLSLLSPGGGSLVVTPLGYEIGLRLTDPKDTPAVWNSTDALTWQVSPVWGNQGYVTALASGKKVVVAAVTFNDGASGFYVSTDNGISWSPTLTTTGGLDLTRADVVVTTSGFVATSNGSGLPLWVAPDTGSPWKPVKPNGIPVTRSFLIDDLLETSGGQLIVFGFDQANSTFDVPWAALTSTSSEGSPPGPTLPISPTQSLQSSLAVHSLQLYLSAHYAADDAAAHQAGHPHWWQGGVATRPIQDGNTLVAVIAYSYDPGGNPVQVLAYKNGQWKVTATLADPWCPCDFPTPKPSTVDTTIPIQVSDVTGDGRPDFLISMTAAGTTPGAVLSQDGAPDGHWRYVPFSGPGAAPKALRVGGSPHFEDGELVSTYGNCSPDCADGTNSTVTWTYQDSTKEFTAPPIGGPGQPSTTSGQ